MPRNPKWPTPFEVQSVIDASVVGGDYLERIRKTKAAPVKEVFDMATLSPDEWFEFILTIVNKYEASMRLNGFVLTKLET